MEDISIMEKGRKLNDTYTLIDELGSGGGGIVYKAYHERLQTYVVVKKVKEKVKGILDERAEADILKKIKHTYLPTVYDFLEIDGEIYTVMDYVPGKSLDKELKELGHFSQKQVLKWAIQLAEALEYLHDMNPPIVHSDIKPANIMLTPENNICLIDFNISLAFDSSMKTSTGISGGYSPPEQYRSLYAYQRFVGRNDICRSNKETESALDNVSIETLSENEETVTMLKTDSTKTLSENDETVTLLGNDRAEAQKVSIDSRTQSTVTDRVMSEMVGKGVDERSDIYSLGATLYHLVTGIKPSNNFEKIVPVDQCGIELSEGFAHIIKKMMEILPENRYQNGSELLYAFHHIYDLDKEFQTYRKMRRNGKIAIILLYLTGGILAGSGWTVRQKEIDTDYNRYVAYAEEQIEKGDFKEASTALDEAFAIRPERIEAYKEELLKLYRAEDYEGCIRYGMDILQNPAYTVQDDTDKNSLADIYYVVGNSYIETEEYSNAAMNLKQAIALYDNNSLYYRDYAIVLAKMGIIEEAESALDQAVSLQLGEDSVYMAQGEIAFAKGEYAKAENYFQQVVSSAEDDKLRKRAVLLCDKVYKTLGTEYIDQEIKFLEQEENQAGGASSAMNISERLADAYVRKAEVDEENRKEYYEKAIECFKLLYENGYITRQIMENIALLYQQMGDYSKAQDMLMQMQEKYPDSYECLKRLAYLEAYIQQDKENADRNYMQMKEYYDQAKSLYGDRDDDQEMQMLDSLMEDLKNGNWL